MKKLLELQEIERNLVDKICNKEKGISFSSSSEKGY